MDQYAISKHTKALRYAKCDGESESAKIIQIVLRWSTFRCHFTPMEHIWHFYDFECHKSNFSQNLVFCKALCLKAFKTTSLCGHFEYLTIIIGYIARKLRKNEISPKKQQNQANTKDFEAKSWKKNVIFKILAFSRKMSYENVEVLIITALSSTFECKNPIGTEVLDFLWILDSNLLNLTFLWNHIFLRNT